LGLIAAVLFVVGVFMPDTDSELPYVWQESAIAALLAFAIETWLRKLDERDAKALQDKLDVVQREIDEAKAPRILTPAQREILKTALFKYKGKKCRVMQVGFGNREAATYASQIGTALSECGWAVELLSNITGGSETISIHSGVIACFNFADLRRVAADNEACYAIIELTSTLAKALEDAGVKMTHAISKKGTYLPTPQDTVDIIVGPKPEPK
jgi:hypothetical protein